jgi:hypothetical protein
MVLVFLMPAHKPSHFFHGSPKLQQWQEASELLNKFQRVLNSTVLPDLARHCRAGALTEGTLCLYASNGAIAAKLRQQAPTLLTGFKKCGLEVTAIRVLVQAAPSRAEPRQAEKRPIGERALDDMEQFAAHLGDSPLKSALTKLLAHQRRAASDQD